MRPGLNNFLWLLALALIAGCKSPAPSAVATLPGFQPAPFDEQTISYEIEPQIKVSINAPATLPKNRELKLIFYALPNGNTIDETIGRRKKPGDDWHFDIQQIGAQTRFLRRRLTNCSIVVVYLQAEQKSWPAWRKEHEAHPESIPKIFESIEEKFREFHPRVTLSSHSGGGSLICAYLRSQKKIPDNVERIAFLDSNYAYEISLKPKLLDWLRASKSHYLSVLAYNDAVALLNGKPFVSANGGTWGRSHAMLNDLAELNFSKEINDGLETYTALGGQVKFLLKENPERQIFHTVQVAKNGFIQSMLSGTSDEGVGYAYFGEPAYSDFEASQ
jgi:hypothetical protein